MKRRNQQVGIAIALSWGLLGLGCHLESNSVPTSQITPPPSSILNDGRVVFAVVRSNMTSGQQENVAIGTSGTRKVQALVPLMVAPGNSANATPTTDLYVGQLQSDDGSLYWEYTFTAADGNWNHLIASGSSAVTATDSLNIPDGQIVDWEVYQRVGPAPLPVGVPANAVATEYRVLIKANRFGNTGNYKDVATMVGERVVSEDTTYDNVLDSSGNPVTGHWATTYPLTPPDATGSAQATESAEAESGTLDTGDQYQESVTVDTKDHEEIKTGTCTTADGIKVPYQVDRDTRTGEATGSATLPPRSAALAPRP